jgi:hypothetical protein
MNLLAQEPTTEDASQFASELDALRQHYTLPPDNLVQEFLASHRSLVPVLLEGAPILASCFGESGMLTLRAPIDEAGEQTLYGIVLWPGPVVDAEQALDKFDSDWWLSHLPVTGGDLTFTYELV